MQFMSGTNVPRTDVETLANPKFADNKYESVVFKQPACPFNKITYILHYLFTNY